MRLPGFVGPSYESLSWTADQEDLINFYIENMESPSATADKIFLPTPGVATIGTSTLGPGRAHAVVGTREFVVIGTVFGEISSLGTITSLGTVALDSNPATISTNGDGGGEIFVTSATNGYIYDLTAGTFTQITAIDGLCYQGASLDGYFLAFNNTTSTVRISELYDGTTWPTNKFFQRSVGSDPWIAMTVADRYIWLLGTDTSEIWYDEGLSPVPFVFHPSGFIRYGCAAPWSVREADGQVTWIGQSKDGEGMVLSAPGFRAERISTYPVQLALQNVSNLADAVADTYEDGGHVFYVLSVPAGKITWCYDLKTGYWHKRGTWLPESGAYQESRTRFHAFAYGQHRWLDTEIGSVYRAASDLPLDVDSRVIRRLRRAPALMNENQRIFYSAFELALDVGVGTATGAGADPQMMLKMSNDAGKTWGPQSFRGAGKIGEYGKRVRWTRLGSARKRVFEITVTDPVPWRITDAFIEIPQASLRQAQKRQAQKKRVA